MISPKEMIKRFFTTRTHNAFATCAEEITYAKIRVEVDGIQETGAAIQHIKELIADYERTPIAWG